MNSENPPAQLQQLLQNEQVDFVVKATANTPLKKALRDLSAHLFGLGIVLFVAFGFFGPLFYGEDVVMEQNGREVVASSTNLGALFLPGAIILLLTLVLGFSLLKSLRTFFSPAPWYAATPKRLIRYTEKATESISWEQCTGTITVEQKGETGSIHIMLRTGREVGKNNRYVPDMVHMIGIQNVLQVERILRQRIEEYNALPAQGKV